MNKIEFNKNYTKLPAGIKTARLVACEAVRGGEQTEAFIKYDTKYEEENMAWGYKIRLDGDHLLLCLISDSGAIFTTLRKDNAENREKYLKYAECCEENCRGYQYNKRIDDEFQIIIKEG